MSDIPSPSDTPSVPAYRPRCRSLCCKSMMVFGEDFESDPDYQAGATDFWCLETSQALGPDNGSLSLELCSDPERPCFRAY